MKINKGMILIFIIFITIIEPGCKKYLSAKTDKTLAVPESLGDLQALLDYYTRINVQDLTSSVQSVDDFYLTDADYNSLNRDAYKQLYTWGTKGLFDNFANDWSYQYDKVNIANIVLDNIGNMERNTGNAAEWDNIKGQALVTRARSFQMVAWQWTKSYDKNEASKDLGIPLRLHSDFNVPSVRASLETTYDRIISDYKQAVPLLPIIPVHVMRPSKPAAYALLARTYLSMGDYANAGNYADSCLVLYNTLLDYNQLNAGASFPIVRFNKEVIMETRMPGPSLLSGTKGKIDSLLYQSYAGNDLRKTVFFKKNNGFYTFKGSYEGGTTLFSGVAVDEIVLIKAECLARSGNANAAMDELNTLLIKRWKTNTFVPLTATNATDALGTILKERRKELLMRGLRWMDIKRLNKEGGNIVMKRIIAGQTYIIAPNALRYAFPLPDDIIRLTGMQQNPE